MEVEVENRCVLVTGGAGFIGSNFIPYFLKKHTNAQLVNLDKLTYAGNRDNLVEVAQNKQYHFIEGDICDRDLLTEIFEKYRINGVIHFAAESHVDNSISEPDNFIKTNIEGTFILLEVAKRFWMESPNQPKKEFENACFHHVSTDEVYGSLGAKGYFTEETAYAPNSPYSASKAAADFLVRSYCHTYGLNVVTSNCSNNYGPKQHDEKLIPTIIRKALKGESIPIYGDGSNVRDWLYVLDHCKGLEQVYRQGKKGETYAIGGNTEFSNLDIAHKICSRLDNIHPKPSGSFSEQITFVADRLGHDFRYAINADKMKRELGWKPNETFDSGIDKTIQWYVNKYQMA